MKVNIAELGVEMNVKTKGTRFFVRDSRNKLMGSLYVSSSGIVWCKGKTTQPKGQ